MKKKPKTSLEVAPLVAQEWHQKLNGAFTPAVVSANSIQLFWWKCPKGKDHVWRATPNNRTWNNSGCPCCDGKQVSITNSLAQKKYSKIAAQWHPTMNGGLTPSDVVAGSDQSFWWKCPKGKDHIWRTSPKHRTNSGSGCSSCAGQQVSITNSLAQKKYSKIAAQWHPTMNGGLTPSDVVAGSDQSYWWKCSLGPDHVWKATLNDRTHVKHPSGCPFCEGKQVSITNSLAQKKYSKIAAQWHPTMNGGLTPSDVVAGTTRKYWFQCNISKDHVWDSAGSNRLRGRGCPYCKLAPRSAAEIRLAYELSALIDFDLEKHKIRLEGKLRDVDIVIDQLNLVVEYDGNWWHRNKVKEDQKKNRVLENSGWDVIRVREHPLKSIHLHDVMVSTAEDTKTVADAVFNKIALVTGKTIPGLTGYLRSKKVRRESESMGAIQALLAQVAAKKAAKLAKKNS
jgi:hypothetical protein